MLQTSWCAAVALWALVSPDQGLWVKHTSLPHWGVGAATPSPIPLASCPHCPSHYCQMWLALTTHIGGEDFFGWAENAKAITQAGEERGRVQEGMGGGGAGVAPPPPRRLKC